MYRCSLRLHNMEKGTLVILFALVAGAHCGPITNERRQCAKTCTASSNFNYENGMTYEFGYEADTITSLAGTAGEHSSLHIRAIADVTVVNPCDFELNLRDVRLEESDPKDLSRRMLAENSADFARALQRSALSFSFQDGRIESLCADDDEAKWIVNIKRGVLSAFQNNMQHTNGAHTVRETDVTGNCEAVYDTTAKDGSTLTIKRTKNLLGCTERTHHVTAFQGMPYNANSDIQSLPLVKSNHECLQTLTEGVLQLTQCTEKHVFRPFSNNDNGASTASVQKLELRRRHRHQKHHHNHGPHRRTDLLFEHHQSVDGQKTELGEVMKTLRQVCEMDDFRPQTGQLFTQLIYHLRQLDARTLNKLHRHVHDNTVCDDNHQAAKKFFLDAIPMVGTTSSVSIIRELVLSGEVTGLQAEHWLTSLAFIAKPSDDMVHEIRPLIESSTASILLPVSAMVGTYCRVSGECSDNMDVQDMVRHLVRNLRNNCDGDENLVLMSLKALANIGHGTGVSTMARCAAHTNNPTNIRVAAMEASRKMPCSNDRRSFLSTFTNIEEDSEVRINAYLASMACPDRHILTAVKRILETEQVNQVGSFVWTHLTNLQETTDPFKKEIKDIVSDVELQKEFDLDKRKFSRNYEGSMFFDSMNTGAKVESNLIWSSKSYVPRSAMVNLTVDLFGHSVNLLEVGGRAEGVESFIESLFGPQGYFPDNPVTTALRKARHSAEDEKMDQTKDRYTSQSGNHPHGSAYMKIFGNELRYVNLNANSMTNPAENINVLDIMTQLANQQEVDMSKSLMFLDSTITLPTVIGIPMKLAVNGTATVKMAIGGKADLRQMMSSPRSMDINGYIKPSGTIEVSSMMSVDAHVARSGLKMVTNLHTSTELNGVVSLHNNEVILAKLNMPRDKIEIMDLKSRFFIVHREAEREQKTITEGHFTRSLCTGAGLKKTLGVELCGELAYPHSSSATAPYFPMSGPAGFKIFLNKADSHSAYEFEARLQTLREDDSSPITSQLAKFSFNTPGSKVNRELLLDFTLNHADKSLSANLKSPWKKAVLSGAVTNEEETKSAALTLSLDETKRYAILAETQISQRGNKMMLTPRLELLLHGVRPMTAQGQARIIPGKMANGEITIDNVFRQPLTLKGGYDNEVRKNGLISHSTSLEVRSNKPLIKASASVDQRDGLNRISMDVAYMLTGPRQRFTYNGLLKDTQTRTQYTLALTGDVVSTQFPVVDHALKVNMKLQKKGALDLDASIQYGGDDKTNNRRIELSHQSSKRTQARQLILDQTTRFTWKAMNIDINTKTNHRHSNDEAKTSVMLEYKPGKKIDFDYHVRKESANPLIVAADASLSYPGRKMLLQEKLEEKTTGYSHEMMVQWQEGSRLTSVGELIMSPNNKYDIRVEVNPPRTPNIVLIGSTSLNIDNFSSKLRIEHDSHTYSVAGAYNYEAMKSVQANVDVDYPGRQILVNAVTDVTGGIYQHDTTVRWDAKRDPSKKFIFNTKFMKENGKLRGIIDISCVGKKYNAAFSHEKKNQKYNTHGEVTWAPGRTATLDTTASFIRREGAFSMEANANFASPIRHLEKLSFSIDGLKNHRMYRNRMNVSWKQGEEINSIFRIKKLSGWQNFESDMAITSPFSEDISAAFNLNTMDRQFTTVIEGSLGNRKIIVNAAGKKELPSVLEGSFKIRTPFSQFRRAGASVRHNLNNNHLENQITGFINNKQVEMSASGKYITVRNTREADLNVVLKTPFRHFEAISGSVVHNSDGHQYANSFEAIISDQRQISGSLDFNHQSNTGGIVSNGKLQLTTPYQGLETFTAEWSHDLKDVEKNITHQASLNGQIVKVDLSHMNNGNEIASKLMLATPFELVQRLIFDVRHANNDGVLNSKVHLSRNSDELLNIDSYLRLGDIITESKIEAKVLGKIFNLYGNIKTDNSPYIGHVEFKWDRDQEVTLDGAVTVSSNRLKGVFRTKTPFTNLEKLLMSFDHRLEGVKYTSSASLEYAPNQIIEINSTIDLGREMSMNLRTPCPYFEAVNVHLARDDGLTLSTAFVSQPFRMTQAIKLQVNSIEDMTGEAKFTSSLTNDITLSLVHKKTGNDYYTMSSLEYAPTQKIVIKQTSAINPDIKAELEITTPFYHMKHLKSSISHAGSASRFQNKIGFYMNTAGEVTNFDSSATVHGIQRAVAAIKASHPRINNIDLALSHHITNGNSNTDFSYGPNKKINLQVTSEDERHSFTLSTPFAVLSELRFNSEHQGWQPNIRTKFDVTVTVFGRSSQASGHLYKEEMEFLDSNLVLETPSKTYTFIAKHSKISGKWVSTVAASSSPENTVATELQYDPQQEELTVSFNSPFKGFEDLRFFVAGKSMPKMKYGKVEFKKNQETYLVEGRVKYNNKIQVNLDLASPHRYMTHMNIKSMATGSLDDFKFNTVLSHSSFSGKVKLDAAVKLALDDFTADATFSSPFNNFEDMKLKAAHKEQGSGRYVSSLVTSYAPNKVVRLQSQLSLNSLSNLEGQISFSSPIPTMRSLQIALNHNGRWYNMKTHFEATLNEDKKTEVDAMLQVSPSVKASLKAVTPLDFARTVDYSFYHSGPWYDFQTQSDLKCNEEKISASANLNVNHGVQGRFILVTPFNDDITATINHKGDIMNFEHISEVNYARNEKLVLNAGASINNHVNIQVEFKAPQFNINRAGVVLSHQGSLLDFQSQVNAFLNLQVIDVKCMLDARDGITATYEMTTPFEPVRDIKIELSHSGAWSAFESKAKLTYAPDTSIESEASISLGTDTLVDLQVSTPFRLYRNMAANYHHKSFKDRFEQDASVSHNDNKVVEIASSLQVEPTLAGSIVMKTQNELLRIASATFSHAGDGDNIKSNFVANINEMITRGDFKLENNKVLLQLQSPIPHVNDVTIALSGQVSPSNFAGSFQFDSDDFKGIHAEAELKTEPEVVGHIAVKTPFRHLEGHSIDFNLIGSFPNIRGHVELDLTNVGKVQIDSSLSTSSGVNGQFRLQTPFTNLMDYQALIDFKGELNNFKNKVEISSKEHFNMQSNAELNIGHESKAAFAFTSDIRTMRDFSASLSHTGGLDQFKSHAEATCTNCGKIELDGEFSLAPVKGEFSFQSPIKNMRKYLLSFRHDGDLMNFNGEAKLMSKEHFTISNNINMKASNGFEGSYQFKSNIDAISDFTLAFDHTGTAGRFRSHLEFDCANWGTAIYDGNFHLGQPIVGNFHVSTPYNGFESLSFNFKIQIDETSLESVHEFTYANGKTVTVTASARTSPSVDASLKFEAPFTSTREVRFSHNGNLMKFTSAASILKAGESKVHYDLAFDTTSAIEGTFNFYTTCPYIDDLKISFKHDNNKGAVKSDGEVKYGYKNVKASFNLNTKNGIESDFKLTTPFKSIQDISASIHHRMWKRRFQTEGTISVNGQNYETKMNMRFSPTIDGDFTLKTPLRQARDIQVTVNHQGDVTDFANGVSVTLNQEEMFNGRVNFKTQPRMEGVVEVKSAHYLMRNSLVTFSHNGHMRDFNTHATVSYNGEQKFNGEIDFKTNPNIQADVKIKTPHSAARQIQVTLTHEGILSAFKSQAAIHYNGKQVMDGVLSFAVDPTIQGGMRIKTPADTVSATLSHQGSLSQFLSKLSVDYNGQKMAAGELNFAAHPTIRGEVKLKTPFRNYRDILAVISHAGSRGQINSAATVNVNGFQKFNTELSVTMGSRFEVDYKLLTPFTSFSEFSAIASHSGSLQAFKTDAKASFNNQPALDSELQFQLAPVAKVYLKVNTPHSKLHNAGITVKYEGQITDFSFDASAQYRGTTEVQTFVSFQMVDTNLRTNLRFHSPYTQDFNLVFTHGGTLQNFQWHAEYNEMKGDVSFSFTPGTVSLSMKTPFPGLRDLSGDIQYTAYNLLAEVNTDHGKFEFDGNYKIKPLSVKIRMASPFKQAREITLDASFKGNHRALYTIFNLKQNGRNLVDFSLAFKNYARTIGSLELKSRIPYAEKIALSFRHEHSNNGLKTHAEGAYYNKEIIADATMKLEPKLNGLLRVTTPFAGFKKTTLKVNGVYQEDLVKGDISLAYGKGQEIKFGANFDRKPSSLETSLNLDTPFEPVKVAGVYFKQDGPWTNLNSNAKVYLNEKAISVDGIYREDNKIPTDFSLILFTPFEGLEKTSLTASHSKEGNTRNAEATFSWMDKKIELSGELQGEISDSFEYTLILKTPFKMVNGKFSESRKVGNPSSSHKEFVHNGIKVYDDTTVYRKSGNKHNIDYTMTLYTLVEYPCTILYKFDGTSEDFDTKFTLNWDSRDPKKMIGSEISHNIENSKQSTVIRVITPDRITGFKSDYEKSSTRFRQKMVLIWDEVNNKMVSYDLSYLARINQNNRHYEAFSRLDTPIRSVQMTFRHDDDGQSYESEVNTMWDAAHDTSRQLTLRGLYENINNQHKHQLVISHPKMTKDIILRNEWALNVNDIIYSGRTELEYTDDEADTLVMSTLVRDHSGNYSLELGLSHPQSKLDVKMNSHLVNTERKLSAGMDVHYLTARSKVNNLVNLRGEIEKIKKMLTMEVLTPVKKLQLNGKIKEKNNVYSVNVVATEDEDKQVSAKFNLDTEAQSVDVKAFYSPANPQNMMHLYGKFIDTTSLTMGATRVHNGRQVVDGEMDVDLKNKHLLHSKIYWRPDTLENARFAAKKAIKLLRQDTAVLYKNIEKSVTREMNAKSTSISKALPSFGPVSRYMAEEAKNLQKDVRIVKRSASIMFTNNEFYMKTGYRYGARVLNTAIVEFNKVMGHLEAKLNEVMDVLNRNFEQVYDQLTSVVSKFIQHCAQLSDAALEKMEVAIDEAKALFQDLIVKYKAFQESIIQKYTDLRDQTLDVIDRYVSVIMTKALDYATVAWEHLTTFAVQIQYRIDSYVATLMSYPQIQHVVAYINTLTTKVTTALASSSQTLADALSHLDTSAINRLPQVLRIHFQLAVDTLSSTSESFLRAASKSFTEARDFISNYARRAIEHENSRRVQDLMQAVYDKVSTAYVRFNVESRTQTFVREAILSSIQFLKRNAYYLMDEFLHLDEDRIIEWNPKSGNIEVQVYIPLKMPDLQTVPFVDVVGAYHRVKAQLVSLTPNLDFSVWDTYYKYKPSSDVSNWLPPFKAHASISGRQHYTTFDGKHYEFAASCSYLLARDVIDANFSMVINYDGVRNEVSKRSVTVTTGGRQVEIFTDGKTTIDGVAAAENLTSWENTELMMEEGVVKVWNSKGITVVCDVEHDSCTLHVSGWYFGKMAGLFGTYNNEQSDDFTTADGQKVTNIAQFASTWSVGRRCARSRNMAHISGSVSSTVCASLFHNKNSPLRPCFAIVHPLPYESMCVNDIGESRSAACNVAAHYVAECHTQEVALEVPTTTCQVAEDGPSEFFLPNFKEYVG